MKYCARCGNSIDDSARFCPHCGASLSNRQASAGTDTFEKRSNTYDSQNYYGSQNYSGRQASENGYYNPNRYPIQNAPVRRDDTLAIVIKVFMILGCISIGWCIIPLAWCVPMTVSVWRKLDAGQPISTGLKVCSLIFVNLIAGICMLCMDD